ncbi:MAG: 2-isopropylmalate synthase [Desulfurococcales archaeon]|nr:2-isopropylmalate synthase [Desulfurococcales archaeon]
MRIELDLEAPPWVPDAWVSVEWRLMVTDTTLRDGMQGWRSLRVEEGLRLYNLISRLGNVVESTELFLYTEEQRRLYRGIQDQDSGPRPVGWIRATLADVRLAVEAGVEETVALASVGPLHVSRKLGVPWSRAREKYLEAIRLLARSGIGVRLALEDVTRAPWTVVEDLVIRALRIAEAEGIPFRVKLSDTLGLGLPFPGVPLPRGVPAMVESLRGLGLEPGQIEFHGHNDLGLVVANHLAAWLYGATYSNCTLLGIGERAGNCPLEVMLLHYVSITGRLEDVNLEVLPRIVEELEEMGYRVPEHQPVVGGNAFNTRAGIHIDGLLKDPRIYLPYHPGIVGRRATIEVDSLSGRSGVYLLLRSLGYRVEGKRDPRVERVYRLLRQGASVEEALRMEGWPGSA